ncbi:MAG: flagellar basal-body MS-ring/collar protein FliF [Alphaproteobacteria bacterium]|nr:flagellar basal-body MS-ring/collar protein FliF [Alphaproteobacteria bacterium]
MQTLRGLGVVRLAALGGTILAVIIFFAFMATKMSSGPLALLYSGLDPSDGGAIVSQLDTMKIPYEVSNNGTSIKVPTEQVGKLRMNMAQQGLPRGGSIGYEIFDQKDGFSTTSFVQNINQLRALEGELARTISTVNQVQSARVHLVLPKHEMFSQNDQKASASVFLKVRGGATLGKEQVGAIRQLIAAAVPNLQTDNISIVDDKGTLLAKAMDRSSAEGEATTQEEMRHNFERTQVDKIEDLLSRSLGYGKARAQVSVEMDFDKVTTSSEIYDPEGQVVRSQVTKSEQAKSSDTNTGVSAGNNLPSAQSSGGAGSNNQNNNSEEQVNYEINKTVRSHVRESGSIKKQSVAVLVDGIYETGADGKQTYKPRSKEELEQIKTLVRSAVNVDATRGDTVEVVNMQFTSATDGQPAGAEGIMAFMTPEMMRMAESVIMALLGLLAILLVVRPILKQVLEGATGAVGESGGNLLGASAPGNANLLSAASGGKSLAPPGAAAGEGEDDNSFEKMIDIQRVEGRVKASSLKKVGEIVEKHPEEAVGIIRNWIYQENK